MMSKDFSFRHIHFEISVRHPDRVVNQTFGYMSLELKEKIYYILQRKRGEQLAFT